MEKIVRMDFSLNTIAITNFREYLRIPSVHPNVNYDECVRFLKIQAEGLDLPVKVYHCTPGKPIVIITWEGSQPQLPSILFNSHMDVVPVFEDKWTHKPFAADLDDDGKIYARGTQDMKSVAIQYIEAVRRLRMKEVSLLRTIHLSFMPDEEISGIEGMKKFVQTDDFRKLNVGFSIDEGMPSIDNDFKLFYGERCIWYVHIHCHGQSGHGSLLLDNTPGEKLSYILNRFMEFRSHEKNKLRRNKALHIGDVTTINLTQVYGGVQNNVIPEKMSLGFDIRIPVDANVEMFEDLIRRWCVEAGDGVEIEFKQKQPQIRASDVSNRNPYWLAFKRATDELDLTLSPQIFPGGTDSRYIRGVGIPAIGFSPINNTPILMHDNDEHLHKDVFLKGIEIYEKIITSVANTPENANY